MGWALAAVVALPLLAITIACVLSAWHSAAWAALMDEPHLLRAWGMTLWTGLASTLLAYWLCAAIVAHSFGSPLWQRVVRSLSPMLAVPHAAMAVGWVFLVAPSGWLLRLLSPWATGFTSPPPWLTSQDPWGLGIIAVLVVKEIPFLLWVVATQLQRDDASTRLQREMHAAQTMGYPRSSAFWQVVWPQLAARIRWPLLAVLAYSLTVVDVAQIAGPSNPPTLAMLAWQWLQDADALRNTEGAIAGWLLALTVMACAIIYIAAYAVNIWTTSHKGIKNSSTAPSSELWKASAARSVMVALYALYASVLAILLVGSVSGVWAFPSLWPNSISLQAWGSVWESSSTITSTLSFAAASTALAMVWAIAWLELAPQRWHAAMRPLLYVPLLLPAVLWVVGVHRLALWLGSEGSWAAVMLAHSVAVLPYVVIALSPAYTGFDARYAHISASMGRSYSAFLWRVKWPLLRASLYAAAAVGMAVSVAQYVPTLYIGEGRWQTVTSEAVTLASGGQRSLVAAYAWLQWLLPVLGFGLAAWLGRPRRFARG
jgi:putative thiamine transport system permease protein